LPQFLPGGGLVRRLEEHGTIGQLVDLVREASARKALFSSPFRPEGARSGVGVPASAGLGPHTG
jgi:hypothetical protein